MVVLILPKNFHTLTVYWFISVMTSPRRSIHSRTDPRVSDLSCVDSASCRQSAVTVEGRCSCSRSHDNLLKWPSAEVWSQNCDFTDTASTTTEYAEVSVLTFTTWLALLKKYPYWSLARLIKTNMYLSYAIQLFFFWILSNYYYFQEPTVWL